MKFFLSLFLLFIAVNSSASASASDREINPQAVTQNICPSKSESNLNTPYPCITEYISNLEDDLTSLYEKYWSGGRRDDACTYYLQSLLFPSSDTSLVNYIQKNSVRLNECSTEPRLGAPRDSFSFENKCKKNWTEFARGLINYHSSAEKLKNVIIENETKSKNYEEMRRARFSFFANNKDLEEIFQKRMACVTRIDEVQSYIKRDHLVKYTKDLFLLQVSNGKNELINFENQQAESKRLKELKDKADQEARRQEDQRRNIQALREKEFQESERVNKITSQKYSRTKANYQGYKQGNVSLIIVSTDENPFYIKRIVINDRGGDPYCDFNRVELFKLGDEKTFSTYGRCGNIVKAVVETNRGSNTLKFNSY